LLFRPYLYAYPLTPFVQSGVFALPIPREGRESLICKGQVKHSINNINYCNIDIVMAYQLKTSVQQFAPL